MAKVPVPQEFRDLGYSGTFWLEIPIDPRSEAEPPALLTTPGWLFLERSATDRCIVVREDRRAVVDLVRPR